MTRCLSAERKASLLLASLPLAAVLLDGASCACNVDGPGDAQMLTALYGYDGCIGVPDMDMEALRARNCTIVTDSGGLEMTNAVPFQLINIGCNGQAVPYGDGLVVTFSHPVVEDTLEPTDFNVTLSDGTTVSPACTTTGPANEGNELHTILLVGHFGDGQAASVQPVSVAVVGDLCLSIASTANGAATDGTVNARGMELTDTPGMSYMTATVEIVRARLETFSTSGEQLLRPNHCDATYGDGATTHRIQVWLSGGGSLDGVRPVIPSDNGVFEVLLANGSALSAPHVLGLADLGAGRPDETERASYVADGDNYFDICLNIDKGVASSVEKIRMPCNTNSSAGVSALVPPKGFPACSPSVFLFDDMSSALSDGKGSSSSLGRCLRATWWWQLQQLLLFVVYCLFNV